MPFDFEKIYPLILQENLSEALDWLDSLPNSILSGAQLELKTRFRQRFRQGTEKYQYSTGNPLAMQVAEHFRFYWNVVLLDHQVLQKADFELENKFIDLLSERNDAKRSASRELIAQNLYQNVNEFLRTAGLYANAMGRTGSFYDLFLWAKQTEENYTVHLPETDALVKVVFMEDFISNGWSYYATFGKYYASGWARAEALYCVKAAYDVSSESFLSSYLPHEAQHFEDYKSFPRLEQADLEYRAKLAELSGAQETSADLIRKFIERSKNDRALAHPFANYCVIRDLSGEIFAQEFVGDPRKWAKITPQEINQASKKLIEQHTADLNKVGSTTVTAWLK